MADTIKVSVLMPSLNVGKYITECMESVIRQSLREIEILCIDAGSADGTLEILRAYEAKDPRVKLILSEKKSYGHQMNLGLAAARGEYIGVVETDDWAEPEMFAELLDAAQRHDADIVRANYYEYYAENGIRNVAVENAKGCRYNEVFTPRSEPEMIFKAPALWSGIYRRSMLAAHDIRFSETPGASFQDTAFFLKLCSVADRALLLDRYYLHYRRDNENSSVNSRGKMLCVCDEMREYEAFLAKCALSDAEKEQLGAVLMKRVLLTYKWNYSRLPAEDQWTFLQVMHEELLERKAHGQLTESLYTQPQRKDLMEVLYAPERFFQRTCKKYAAHPALDRLFPGELLRECSLAQPQLSLILPARNAAAAMSAALESALLQTLNSLEILCLDEAPKDAASLPAPDDPRLTLVRIMDQGKASARNIALRLARGKYLLFLDDADALRADACAYLLEQAEEKDLDILCFNGSCGQPAKEKDGHDAAELSSAVVPGDAYLCLAGANGNPCADVTAMLLRRELLHSCRAAFTDGLLLSERAFCFRCLMNAKRVWHSPEALYLQKAPDEAPAA